VAQESTRFYWEATLETGVDSTIQSDIAVDKITDVYATYEASGTLQFTDRILLFSTVTIKSMIGAISNRVLEGIGVYVNELGLSFDFGNNTISVGKIGLAFDMAWDAAPWARVSHPIGRLTI